MLAPHILELYGSYCEWINENCLFRQEDLEDQERKERRTKQMKKNIKLMAIALIVLGIFCIIQG